MPTQLTNYMKWATSLGKRKDLPRLIQEEMKAGNYEKF